MAPVLDPSTLLAAGAVVLLTALCRAQSDAPKQPLDPAVTTLLDKMATTRGVSAPKPTTSITIEGDYAVTFGERKETVAKGPFRDLFVGTTLARETSETDGAGAMEKGLSGDLAWELDPMMGAKVHSGGNAAAMRRYFALLRGDDPRTLYVGITAEPATLGGRAVTRLQMTPAEGPPATWYVDADGTLLQVETALPAPEATDPKDAMRTTITFADWKKVDGGRFPMQRKLQMGPATVTFTCRAVTVGTPIEAARFQPPAAVAKAKPHAAGPEFEADGTPVYQLIDRDAQPVASIRMKIKPSEITTTLSTLLPEVHNHLTAVGAKMAGPPFSRYHAWSDTEIDIEAGIPVQAPIEAKGRVVNSTLPAGKTLTVWHIGPYDQLAKAHEGLRAQREERKLKARGGPWEVYFTDPGMVPDPSKWRTQLFQPVE